MAEMHKHLIVNATLAAPPTDPEVLNDWLERVVKRVQMNVFIPPVSRYCDTPGNEGITGMVVIDTSHCSIHVWDGDPATVKADLYSCKDFDPADFIDMLREFGLRDYQYMVIDRSAMMKVQDFEVHAEIDDA